MPRKRKHTVVFGPYPHRRKWRLVLRAPDGSQDTQSFATKKEATRAKVGIEAAILKENAWAEVARLESQLEAARAKALSGGEARTVRDLINVYIAEDRQPQVSAGTCALTTRELNSFLKRVLDASAASVTPARAAAIYKEGTERVAVATHHKRLERAKQLWSWAAERRWVRPDVWSLVKPVGKKNRGKPQPRRSEAVLIYNRAFELAEHYEGSSRGLRGLIVITQILLALRSSELLGAVGRDIDSGRWYIDRGKTANSTRVEEIPSRLRPLLERRAAEAGPHGRLFPFFRNWPRRCAVRLCISLGLPPYNAHAMRGLHASLSAMAGVTSHEIARTLGHGSTSVTESHYISEEAKQERAAKQRRDAFAEIDPGITAG